MTWHFYALQQLSDRLSRGVDEAVALGVAAFRLGGHPSDPGAVAIRILERDASLGDAGGEGSPDDLLGTIHCDVAGGEVTFRPDLDAVGASSDPILIVRVYRRESDDAPLGEWRVPVPAAARADEHEGAGEAQLEVGLLGPDQTFDEDAAPVTVRLTPPGDLVWAADPAVDPATEWDRSSEPRDGQTLFGHRLTVVITGTGAHRRVRVSASPNGIVMPISYLGRAVNDRGVYYTGTSRYSCMHDAKRDLKREFTDAGEHWRALLVEAYDLLGEGEVSAVNTYDSQYITLGAGYAGGRLGTMHDRLPAGGRARALLAEALSGLDCFDDDLEFSSAGLGGQWTAAARRARLHLPTYSRYVQLTEHRRYCMDFARANVLEFVEFDGVGARPRPADLTWGNAQAPRWPAEVPQLRALAGLTAYLRHGRNNYTEHPIADVKLALERASTPSAQLAVVIKLHVERCWHRRQADSRPARRMLDGALGVKMRIFQGAMRTETGNAHWPFEMSEAQAFLPCLTGTRPTSSSGWEARTLWGEGTDDPPAAGRVFLVHSGKHYDFGPPLRDPPPASSSAAEDEGD